MLFVMPVTLKTIAFSRVFTNPVTYVVVIVLDITPAHSDVFSHVLSLSFLTMVLYQIVIYLLAYCVCQ